MQEQVLTTMTISFQYLGKTQLLENMALLIRLTNLLIHVLSSPIVALGD